MAAALPGAPCPVLAAWEAMREGTSPAIEIGSLDSGQPMRGPRSEVGTTVTTNETETTPEIRALARALRNDPLRIYEYVKNRVDYRPPTYGVGNGATGCLLAGRGNDWDQACLLSSLLRTAGYTNRFVEAAVTLPKEQLAQWFGVDTNHVKAVVERGGNVWFYDENDDSIGGMYRMWVEAKIDGTWYTLDPAYKQYEAHDGLDLSSAMNYSLGAFMSGATNGSVMTSDYVQDVNRTAITNLLTEYTTNLIGHLSSNYPNHTRDEVVGGRHIVRQEITNLPTALPEGWTQEGRDEQEHIADSYSLRFRIEHGTIDHTFKGYETAGKRSTIFYDVDGSQCTPELRLDGQLIETGSTVTVGQTLDLVVTVYHPYRTDSYTLPLETGSGYLLILDAESSSSRLVEREGRKLNRYLALGLSEDSEAVLGTGMNLTVLRGLEQWRMASRLLGDLSDVEGFSHHFVGVLGYKDGYYVDLPGLLVGMTARYGGEVEEYLWFRALGYYNSSLEHGMLEQSQGNETPCLSTVKLLQISNDDSKKTFLTDSNNWSSVAPQLIHYSSSQTNEINYFINQGHTFLLPEDADITLDEWTGLGYAQFFSDLISMIIDGGYSGGYASKTEDFDPITVAELLSNESHASLSAHIATTTAADPVDLRAGANLFSRQDLSTSGSPPRNSSAKRAYDSKRRFTRSPLGYGWTHDHNIRVHKSGNAFAGLGQRRPIDAAPFISQAVVLLDLLAEEPSAAHWVSAVLAANWGMDQLVDNGAAGQIGSRRLEFIEMPDGSYNPPPAVTTEFIKTNGLFRLVERFGTEYRFNTNGLVSSIVDADGNTMSFAYNAQTNLQTVTDSYSRTLTFSYTSGKLSGIIESAGGLSRSVSFGYADDDLASFTDPDGGVWKYRYDTNHQMIALVDALDQVTTSNVYNDIGQVVTQFNGYGEAWAFYCTGYEGTEVDPESGETTHWFDDDGRNLGTEDALGNRTYNYYDGQGHLVSNVDARGFVTVYRYDADHNLTNRVDALGNAWTYEYDAAHHLVAATDPLGHTTHYGYDANHHLTNTVDALTNETVVSYYTSGSHKGLPHIVTDPNGNVTTTTYDSYGNAHTIARTDGGTVTNTWSARGDLLVARDAIGNPTTMTYDRRRLVTSITDALGNIVSNIYDAAGLKTKVIDPLDRETVTAWTPTYEVAKVTFPDDSFTTNVYDSRDWLVAMVDRRGNATSNVYDSAGRKIAVVDRLTNTTHFVFDPAGNVVARTNALGKTTTFLYDGLSRLVMTTDPLSHSVSNSFDLAGRLVAVTDETGYQTVYTYDAANRRTMLTKPDGVAEHFTYDSNGNLTAFHNGLGRTRTFGYDGMNRVTNEVDAVGNVRGFVFDAVGNLLERHDAGGAVIEYDYDDLDRPVEVAYPDTSTVHYAYNEVGLRTYQSNAVAEVWYGFDNMNRLSAVTQSVQSAGTEPVESVVSYAHDLNGNRTNIVYPGAVDVGYTFDAADRLTDIQLSAFIPQPFSFSYDDLHRNTGIDYPTSATGTWTWDDASRLTRVQYHNGTSNFVDRVYTLDARGNIAAMEVNAGLLPQPAPQIRRLVQNAADELTCIETKTDPGIQSWTTNSPIYDAEGNLTADGTLGYAYDDENRLTYVTSSSAVVTYSYAGDGTRMASETIEGASTNIAIYVIDHADPLLRPLAELDETGTLVRRFVWGRGLVAQIEADGTVHYFHHDGQGSTLALTDTNSVTTDLWFYSPYGEIMNRTGTTETAYQWCGGHGVRLTPVGLYFMKARYYHAGLKRFLSQDPIGIAGGANLYAYCFGNPLFFIDPDGKCGTQNRLEFNMPGYGSAQSYQIVGGNVRNLTVSDLQVAGNMYGSMALGVARASTLGDIETLVDPSAGLGWKAAAVGSILLDVAGVGQVPGTSTGVLRAGARGAAEVADSAGDVVRSSGRAGRQLRLRRLVDDVNVSSADRGWIRQEINQINRGTRGNIRVPPGRNLAHRRGFQASRGFDYRYSDLQDVDLHKLQHRYEGY